MNEEKNWLNFTKQMALIDDLFTHECFVSAHKEVQRLEKFTRMFAARAMREELKDEDQA